MGINLKDFLPMSDEARCYYQLYGDLYFRVPHYVRSVSRVEDDGVQVVYASGTSTTLWRVRSVWFT